MVRAPTSVPESSGSGSRDVIFDRRPTAFTTTMRCVIGPDGYAIYIDPSAMPCFLIPGLAFLMAGGR